MSGQDKKYYSMGSIGKACNVLEVMAARRYWDLAELARVLSLPKTTVHRILLTFEDCGFIQQEQRGGRYGLSYKLFSLGSQSLRNSNLLAVGKPLCHELWTQLDETIELCVVSGINMMIVGKEFSSRTLRPEIGVGSVYPLFYAAAGKAFLAFKDVPVRERMVQWIVRNSCPPVSAAKAEQFLRELGTVRQKGIASDMGENQPGFHSMAVPVLDNSEQAVAAVSVTMPADRLTPELATNVEHLLLHTGREISRRMGSNQPVFVQ